MSTSHRENATRGSDIYLHMQAVRAGKIKGESQVAGHIGDILVSGWHWSVASDSAIGSNKPRSRRSYSALRVTKKIDMATTALMSSLAKNDEIKEAKLTMRKSGGEPIDYLTITLSGARISGLEHTVQSNGDTVEELSISFTTVEVEYQPQGSAGLASGGTTKFNDDVLGEQ